MEITKIIKTNSPQPKAAEVKRETTTPSVRSKDESATTQNQSSSSVVSEQELIQAAKELEVRYNLSVKMVTDETTGREVVRIFSEDGERLLRQMPPEQVLRMVHQARQGTLDSILSNVV